MNSYSYISNAHPSFIEALYKDFQQQPNSVDAAWRSFFEGFEFAIQYNPSEASNGTATIATITPQQTSNELKAYQLIKAYRDRGHLIATTNPLKNRRDRKPHLDLSDFGLTEEQLNQSFSVGSQIGLPNATLAQIIERLKAIYCRNIGLEYGYLTEPHIIQWLRERFENRPANSYSFSHDKKMRILQKLTDSATFEQFLHTRFVGQKRFSLEGGESTVPGLDAIITYSADLGVKEVVIGMAHRGRLNILANIMGKSYKNILNEFEGNTPSDFTMGSGDVKYHLGYSSLIKTPSDKEVYLKLTPNPSHLEAVNPVVEGFARAKADLIYDHNYDQILPILIHGDAAVAGQGIVYEVLQMSKLDGYYTGGTIHFVINNQIGFTTDFDDARSSDYCTSLAAMVKAPVLHVNGDDVEAVVFVCELAAAYRQEFNGDIFIDMVCYRKYGHNEGDDPQYTQPQMFELIKNHKNPRELYVDILMKGGEVEAQAAEAMNKDFWEQLQGDLIAVRQNQLPYLYQEPELAWKSLRRSTTEDFEQSPITGISSEQFQQIINGISAIPDDFHSLKKAQRQIVDNLKQITENQYLNWATAELSAYASVLLSGSNVRMSGQDVKRGTFSHRHAVLFDEKDNSQYNRLNHIAEKQGKFLIYNSLLSEYAVLGFEYGYAMASPETLTIWEAQFGDFSNGAQIIIDQFLSSAESKWQRMNGIVLLLPHGYEGQGPEHSSARMERYLQLCAENNIVVANITTPANLFHALRRQQVRPFRKPLIIMSPKSMLRQYASNTNDILGETRFQEIIADNTVNPAKVTRVALCSGKIAHELTLYRQEKQLEHVAIVRLEQLYPIAQQQLKVALEKYPKAELTWVQEEPANAGAWWHINHHLSQYHFRYIGRPAAASPATGFAKKHAAEQRALVEAVFA
ncbi:MAG: 2-oxoglutarate dehydrogenase E1 component [Chitinophagales bacterium]|nr:2-oxoglutarate dehydrogenase E1 component [Chitinophagales bacterium]